MLAPCAYTSPMILPLIVAALLAPAPLETYSESASSVTVDVATGLIIDIGGVGSDGCGATVEYLYDQQTGDRYIVEFDCYRISTECQSDCVTVVHLENGVRYIVCVCE